MRKVSKYLAKVTQVVSGFGPARPPEPAERKCLQRGRLAGGPAVEQPGSVPAQEGRLQSLPDLCSVVPCLRNEDL